MFTSSLDNNTIRTIMKLGCTIGVTPVNKILEVITKHFEVNPLYQRKALNACKQ